MKELIEKFIKENSLKFSEGRRNSDSVILSGYIQFLEKKEENKELHLNYPDICEIIDKNCTEAVDYEEEFERVFDYTQGRNYAAFWEKEEAKKMYEF